MPRKLKVWILLLIVVGTIDVALILAFTFFAHQICFPTPQAL